jgi:hypothetical protein
MFWGRQALVDQWIDIATLEIDGNVSRWLYPRLGMGVFHEEVRSLTSGFIVQGKTVASHIFRKYFLHFSVIRKFRVE